MNNLDTIEKMKSKIESKRNCLNRQISSGEEKHKLLKTSMELDKLISEYYSYKFNINNSENIK